MALESGVELHWSGIGLWGGVASECGWTSDLRRSVGWSNFDLSSVRGGGVKGFVAVAFSWNWNWRACEAKGCEF